MKQGIIKKLFSLTLMLCIALAASAQGTAGVNGPKKKKQTTTTTTTTTTRQNSSSSSNAQKKKKQTTTTTTRQNSSSSNAQNNARSKEQAEQKAEQEAREQEAREQAAREQAAREQAARDQVAREQAAREQAEREEQARKEKAEQEARFNSVQYNSSTNTITYKNNSYKMVYVSGGTFTMGATSEQGKDAGEREKPAHRVTLSSYYIGQTEVPQWLWTAVMGSNPSRWKDDNLPVEKVSWNDCQTFISKLNSLTGENFELPTEAQWEFAARGGNSSRGYKYSGSNYLKDVAWYDRNSGGKIHNVGTKSPNELGLYDMSGNVWELCSDWYGSYSSSSQTDPRGAESGSDLVSRGGCCDGIARICRVSARSTIFIRSLSLSITWLGHSDLGLRLALRP